VRTIWLKTSVVMRLQSRHSPPPSSEVEFTPQSLVSYLHKRLHTERRHTLLVVEQSLMPSGEAQAVRL
jgi:hypothetical protein